jgi:hypothetical protein
MTVEEQMKIELRRLEKEIELIDDELEKLHTKIIQLILLRKKKEKDLRIIRSNFGEDVSDEEIQTSLAKLLRGTKY